MSLTMNVTQGHQTWHYFVGNISLSIVVCSNYASVLHHFQNITIFQLH